MMVKTAASALGLAFLSSCGALSCGGKVVLDTGGHGGGVSTGSAGGAGGALTASVGSMVGSTGSGTSTCSTSTCSGDAAGDCSCTGSCSDGSTIEIDCGTDPAIDCTCSKNGVALGNCSPAADPPACQLPQSCCAAMF